MKEYALYLENIDNLDAGRLIKDGDAVSFVYKSGRSRKVTGTLNSVKKKDMYMKWTLNLI